MHGAQRSEISAGRLCSLCEFKSLDPALIPAAGVEQRVESEVNYVNTSARMEE